jgi:hypothetical protein
MCCGGVGRVSFFFFPGVREGKEGGKGGRKKAGADEENSGAADPVFTGDCTEFTDVFAGV